MNASSARPVRTGERPTASARARTSVDSVGQNPDAAIDANNAGAIRLATTPLDVTLARTLFVEYAQWLNVDLCFQGFDQELRTLPGAYAPPRGRLLLAGTAENAFACIALRALGSAGDQSRNDEGVGEVKRLYVQPTHRNQGWGERLVRALIAEAGALGYRELKLDTLDWMAGARALYERLGFSECRPYYANPLRGAVYMAMRLERNAGAGL